MPRQKTYPSDLSDFQWDLIAPHLPVGKRGGRPRTTDIREVLNGILFILKTGCQWHSIPEGFPPKSTVYWYFKTWRDDGTLEKINDTLRRRIRVEANREPEPSRIIIDSQSTKTTEVGGEK
jgi:putative transposase